jgi:hypothetical protein
MTDQPKPPDEYEPSPPIGFDHQYVEDRLAIDDEPESETADPEAPKRLVRHFLTGLVIVVVLALLGAIAGASIAGYFAGQQDTDFSDKAERRSICTILNQAQNNALERRAAELQRASSDLARQSAALDRAVSRETSLFVEGLEIIVTTGDENPRLAEIIHQLEASRALVATRAAAVESLESEVSTAEGKVAEAEEALALSDTYTLEQIGRINAGEAVQCVEQ